MAANKLFQSGHAFNVAFSGGRELERALRELGSLRRVKSALTRAGKRALQPIAEATRQRAPRDTEELAKGVTVRPLTRRQGGSADAVTLGVVFTGPHRTLAHLYEFGFTQAEWPALPRPAVSAAGVGWRPGSGARGLPAVSCGRSWRGRRNGRGGTDGAITWT